MHLLSWISEHAIGVVHFEGIPVSLLSDEWCDMVYVAVKTLADREISEW